MSEFDSSFFHQQVIYWKYYVVVLYVVRTYVHVQYEAYINILWLCLPWVSYNNNAWFNEIYNSDTRKGTSVRPGFKTSVHFD